MRDGLIVGGYGGRTSFLFCCCNLTRETLVGINERDIVPYIPYSLRDFKSLRQEENPDSRTDITGMSSFTYDYVTQEGLLNCSC